MFRTCREIGVRTVAVYTPPDAGAPFVTEADAAVPLDGARGYLDIGQILAAAEATGADAVHPGWGFLAENAAFAEACIAAGLTWVGPPPPAMESMGSKIEARRLMEAAGVPVVPGATLSPAAAGAGADYPQRMWANRSARRRDRRGRGSGRVSVAGQGFRRRRGKGMRLVDPARKNSPRRWPTPPGRRRRRSGTRPCSSSGTSSPGRHVEVQVLGDHHGTVVHLFERDCSVQRRHQKLVEESPSPAVDDDLRARMGQAAVAAAEAVGYHGVGTVEFLLGPDGAFYFLEMNTRLQVEHPVTELVTGLDLVRLQLAVAEGRPLPPEVHGARITGHAVEVRLYAEDPLHDYQPQTGRVEAIEFPDLPGLRLDSGVEAGSVIGTDYDSMLAKVIATGPTRAEAVRFLIDALRRARIHGVGTNRDLLLAILDHDEFGAGQADTGFLDRHPPDELLAPTLDPAALRLHALAAALAASAAARAAAPVLRPVRSGFRNNPGPPPCAASPPATPSWPSDTGSADPRCSRSTATGPARVEVLVTPGPDAVELVVDGVRRRFDVRRYRPWGSEVSPGVTACTSTRRSGRPCCGPSTASPTGTPSARPVRWWRRCPGTVVKVLAAPGDLVAKGDPVVVIEAMKMEHTIGAAGDGTVAEVLVEVGHQVDSTRSSPSSRSTATATATATTAASGRRGVGWLISRRWAAMRWPSTTTCGRSWSTSRLTTGIARHRRGAGRSGTRSRTSPTSTAPPASRWSTPAPSGPPGTRPSPTSRSSSPPLSTTAGGSPAGSSSTASPPSGGPWSTRPGPPPEGIRIPWYGPDMAVASSITARIMETWAHGQDVADALGAERPPTGRIRHVCDIGIRARPFSYRNRGLEPPETPLRVELVAPDGSVWEWGPPDAADRVAGPALDFALLVTQRRIAADTALVVEGDDARTWIGFAQAFAGNPTDTDPSRRSLPLPGQA